MQESGIGGESGHGAQLDERIKIDARDALQQRIKNVQASICKLEQQQGGNWRKLAKLKTLREHEARLNRGIDRLHGIIRGMT